MKRSFYFRLFLSNALIFLVLLSILSGLGYYVNHSQFIEHQQLILRDWAEYISDLPLDRSRITQELSNYALDNQYLEKLDLKVDLIDVRPGGFWSYYRQQYITNLIRTRINTTLVLQGFPQESYVIDSGNRQIEFVYGQSYKLDQDKTLILYLRRIVDREYQGYLESVRRELFYTLLILGIGLLMISLLSYHLFDPVKNLANTAREVSEGNLNARVYLGGNDEHQVLADSFNLISENNLKLISELSREKDELQAIISSLHEALWLMDEQERVVFSNSEFCSWVEREDVEGHHYWELIREKELDKLIDQVRDQKQAVRREIIVLGRSVIFNGLYVASSKRVLVVLHDISDFRQAQLIKKDLISSVSHELKTPLTSIKGFVETLRSKNQGSEDDHFLSIIERNTNRLERIVQDLLLLSNLEEGGHELEVEDVDVNELIKGMTQLFREKFNKKGLSLEVVIEDQLRVETDAFKLEQVFINLIENALKYTEQGGLIISGSRDKQFINIHLKDTGIGIAEHHQSRLFERFYVVDKSRSRQQGGTGLGLSIVRHSVELLQGEVLLQSVLQEGTTITLKLPLKLI